MSKITVISPENKITFTAPVGTVLANALAENGFAVPAACGQKGTCGKCRVRLLSGNFNGEIPDNNMTIRSCKAIVCNDAVIGLDFQNSEGLTEFTERAEPQNGVCGIAVDIGTTTVAAAFLKKDGSIFSASCLNPQSAYGADVISRIEACSDGKLDELTKLIRKCIKNLIDKLDINNESEELVVSGNTTMLHIFCGISPESMGTFPFTPQFTDVQYLNGAELGYKIKNVTVLPSISAFVGSDIVAGIYALGLHKTDKVEFLADLGTNGELVLSDKGKLYCTSTAAGPALEGACIDCGIGGVEGAVDKVFDEDGETGYTTVGNKKPVGICGAGLTDAIALLLERKLVDAYGYLEENFKIAEKIYISPKDIRQFQLAKSAVFSGIEVLAKEVGTEVESTDKFYIAGGLGYYINPESAINVGLIPRIEKSRIKAAGNTSLKGALMCIGNKNVPEEMQKAARDCTQINLGGNSDFNQKFMDNMLFR